MRYAGLAGLRRFANMFRKRFEWKLQNRSLILGDRTLIMGVLNVTPDSFTDGGKFADPDRAYAHALEMEDAGADLIDVGAESTRPGSQRISEAEELRRLVPVLKKLRDKLNVPISVDTYKASVAARALEYGAEIINDPSGLTFDVQLARTVANTNAGLVINHMRGTPETWSKLPGMPNVLGSLLIDLDASVNRARHSGMDLDRIVIDPGLGFGKRKEQNSQILAQLPGLGRLGRPILIGPSRKHFLAQTDDRNREFATAAAVTASILSGAHIVRVHDVRAMTAVAQVADAILAAEPEPEPSERDQPRRRPAIRPVRSSDQAR